MFKKILIANRGEIACRVIRTARRMGIATVAVYSEADADALHVAMADEAVLHRAAARGRELPADRPDRRGLQADRRRGGASGLRLPVRERGVRRRRWRTAGIASSARRPAAIAAMGDKIEIEEAGARRPASRPCPGIIDADRRRRRTRSQIAREIGYPVMIKASAGGGGKGMRIARDDARGCCEGFARAAAEARSSFGDDRVFIEKYVEEPRHIEIQVLGDSHGNVVYLGERECSIQRRHQKVIEEAPSPFLDAATRAGDGRAGGGAGARRSATTRPARSSSSSTRTATSTSSR